MFIAQEMASFILTNVLAFQKYDKEARLNIVRVPKNYFTLKVFLKHTKPYKF